MEDKVKYMFKGHVSVFGKYVTRSEWTASTYASTLRKAVSNLKYRFRIETGYERTIPVELFGTMYVQGGEVTINNM